MNLSNLIIDSDDDGDWVPPVPSLALRMPEERGGRWIDRQLFFLER
jgi:hypothetical protein